MTGSCADGGKLAWRGRTSGPKGGGRSRFPEGMTERKSGAKAVPLGTWGRCCGGVNWRDENENLCGAWFGFVGGDGLCGGWADGGDASCWGEAADDVCGFDGDEAGE